MGPTRVSSEADSPVAVSNMLLKLYATNFAVWWEDFQNNAGQFRDAGLEVLSSALLDLEPLYPTEFYDYFYRTEEGELKKERYPWDDQQGAVLVKENQSRARKLEMLCHDRGKLWAQLLKCLHPDVSNRLKTEMKKEFQDARERYDNVALMEMVKTICGGMARDRLLELQGKLRSTQMGNTEPFDAFCLRLEDLFDQLAGAGDNLTTRDKTGHLINCIKKDWWATVISDCLKRQPSDPLYPEYEQQKKDMATFYRSMKPTGKRKNPEAEEEDNEHDQAAEAKDYFKRHKKVSANLAAAKAKINKLEAMVKLQEDSADKPALGPCYRCGLMGHFSNNKALCKAGDVKCGSCGSTRHLEKFCKIIKSGEKPGAKKQGKPGKKFPKKAQLGAITMIRKTSDEQTAVCNVGSGDPVTDGIVQVVGDHLPTNPVLGSLSTARAKPAARQVHLRMVTIQDYTSDGDSEASPAGTADSSGSSTEAEHTDASDTEATVEPTAPSQANSPAETVTSTGQLSDASDSHTEEDRPAATPTGQLSDASDSNQVYTPNGLGALNIAAVLTEPMALEEQEEAPEVNKAEMHEVAKLLTGMERDNTDPPPPRAPRRMDEVVSDADYDPDYDILHDKDFRATYAEYGNVGLEREILHFNNEWADREKMVESLRREAEGLFKTEAERDKITRKERENRRRQISRVAVQFKTKIEPSDREGLLYLLAKLSSRLNDQAGRLHHWAEKLDAEDGEPALDAYKTRYLTRPHIPLLLRSGLAEDKEEAERKKDREAAAAANKNNRGGGRRPAAKEVKKVKASGATDTEDEENAESDPEDPPSEEQRKTRSKRRKPDSPPLPKARDHDPSDESEDNDLEKVMFAKPATMTTSRGAAAPKPVSQQKASPPQKKGKTTDAAATTAPPSALSRLLGPSVSQAEVSARLERMESGAKQASRGKAVTSPPLTTDNKKNSTATAAGQRDRDPKTSGGKPATPAPPARSTAPAHARSSPPKELNQFPDRTAAPKPAAASKRDGPAKVQPKRSSPDRTATPGTAMPSVREISGGQPSGSSSRTAVGGTARASTTPPPTLLSTINVTGEDLLRGGLVLEAVQINPTETVLVLTRPDGSEISNEERLLFISSVPQTARADTLRVAMLGRELIRARLRQGETFTKEQPTGPNNGYLTMVQRKARVRSQGAKMRAAKRLVVDSGAAVTVYRQRNDVVDFQPTGEELGMTAANGEDMKVDDVGNVRGLGTVVLSRAANADILSVSQLCTENPGLTVTFDAKGVVLSHPALDEPIRGDITEDLLYSIDAAAVTQLIRARLDRAPVYTTTARPMETDVPNQSEAAATPTAETAVTAETTNQRTAVREGAPAAAADGHLQVELTSDEELTSLLETLRLRSDSTESV